MSLEENIDQIKEIVKEFFKKTSFNLEVYFLPVENNTLSIEIKTNEPQILIGEGGQTLANMQHILKAILRKKIDSIFYLNIDINDYKKNKLEYLKELAREAAEEVVLNKKVKELDPMRSFERRIVHMELAQRKDILTESIGNEPERRIIIKPVESSIY
jgi:spoIIIJ-associated protein